MAQHNEASVEEILESIKKVMARDSAPLRTDEAPDRRPADVLDLAEMELGPDEELAADDDEPLTTDAVRASMRDNFAALAMLAEPGARPQIVRSGETSLEGLVREMLRPMLAEWLDANLPGMVDKMVQAEIARIAGKRG
ncbi:MAG: hypothetical protein A3J40_10585 [Erythrobacter sp. RIFCSPHIGHO2_12_FULL_63_10]|nr:MAG: hypothetical protein A3J40_10585 [Erythrobacter sp. RIFCSPHIGHO2_12_FULL_63_10]